MSNEALNHVLSLDLASWRVTRRPRILKLAVIAEDRFIVHVVLVLDCRDL